MMPDCSAQLSDLIGKQLKRQTAETLDRYVDILATTGVERGLLGPREAGRIWSRHVLNCAALAPLLPERATVADLGSGAGLPGVVLAVLRPDVTMILIEPLLRRATFLGEVVAALQLEGTTSVVRQRAEDMSPGRVDVVVARAVAPLDRLAAWALPLLRPGGVLLAMKGEQAEAELAAHLGELRRLGAEGPEVIRLGVGLVEEPTTVVTMRRR